MLLLLIIISGSILATPVPLVRACTSCSFLLTWGSLGASVGQFHTPEGVAVDSSGNVYVADYANNRVEKFTSTSAYVTQWGQSGIQNGNFSGPNDVAVDSSGNVYVTDRGNNRVEKFTSTGTFITTWGSSGSGNSQFDGPGGVAVDSSGNVYVTDINNNRVEKFTSTGTFITTFYTGVALKFPQGVAVDSSGNVYVIDSNNNRVVMFSSTGMYSTQWGSSGSGYGQFKSPVGVAVDSFGNVYVADMSNNRVEKFTSAGTYITTWGSSGSGYGQFNSPTYLAVDSSGNVYVADAGNNRIEMFGVPVGATSVSISLVAGWNLISLPLVPYDTRIGIVLSDLVFANNLTIVWSYQGGGWKFFVSPLATGLPNTLTTMQDGFGYWIYMTRRSTLVVSGYVVPPGSVPSPVYQLAAGWNLLGFKPQPTVKNETVGVYLASVIELSTTILVYDNLNYTWILASPDTQLAPGEAIWIKMNLAEPFTPPWVT